MKSVTVFTVSLFAMNNLCISEVTDISPGNLDFTLCFTQLSISHDILCIYVK